MVGNRLHLLFYAVTEWEVICEGMRAPRAGLVVGIAEEPLITNRRAFIWASVDTIPIV